MFAFYLLYIILASYIRMFVLHDCVHALRNIRGTV